MRPHARVFTLIVLLLAGGLPLLADASIRCGGNIVQRGDSTFDLLAICGEPTLREPVRFSLLPDGRSAIAVERWYYNRGPQRLVRIVDIRDGRVQRIDSGGYGFNRVPGSRCPAQQLQRGMNRLELLARCGEPDATQTLEIGRFKPGHARRLVAVREEWYYDYGSGQIPRIVHLQAGKVIRVEQGRRR
ncbi:DUF2845 domain-containing protein [Methylonatrum kenyense]|uniref:DUF2845 domain-containing protein n=1 Tax=Methylonatrum kenyense TaxID=455253 RepID=UPI0020BF446A|nr:DUF2845 domain-containing protein [Methylonatrum kenyense]MCK8516891.1 DUF2845 domain-containing protein [Methylonatrum kenyense]